MDGLPFREVWAADFEYGAANGGRPVPVCLVAKELRSGRLLRLWHDDFGRLPPYPTDSGVLFVAYYATAEVSCHLALGWPVPERILDLFTEYRVRTNGAKVQGRSLLHALDFYGLPGITKAEKDAGRNLAMQGHWTAQERRDLLDYCQTDVDALAALLPRMRPDIEARRHGLVRALLRGRYMAATARVEATGVPVDTDTLALLRDQWDDLKLALIAETDQQYGVFEGTTFKLDRFERWLRHSGIPWPRTDAGRLRTDRDTFRDMAKTHPSVAALHEVRHSLAELRLESLAVGPDGRNRVMLGAFGAKTGRNTPTSSAFVFGPAVWLRGLVKPEPGRALAYLDFASQEVVIAAALSQDHALLAAIESGDPYMYFARMAGLAPPGATKATHPTVRALCKTCLLGSLYGMGPFSLAQRTGTSLILAQSVHRALALTFPTFWRWIEHVSDLALLSGELRTVFGWPVQVNDETRATTLRTGRCRRTGPRCCVWPARW
jgi:DNA polymerase I